jgi:hypothetical protein
MKRTSTFQITVVLWAIFTAAGLAAGVAAMAQGPPSLAGCPVLPGDNIWNTPIDNLPVDANSDLYITTIGATKGVHPDFGSGIWDGGPIGIPYNVVTKSQPKVSISFDYADESDPGPYPIPTSPAIEGGADATGDRHILVLDRDNCILYETWSSYPQANGSWMVGSGAIFDLRSNGLRPDGWTSSDAAGLPILPGLVRYDEVAAGEITHAIRFTAQQTRKGYVWPARHYASSLTDKKYPPMGQRFRLKASFDTTGFAPEVQIILQALKRYGMILADNGSSWFISGVPDARWDDDVLVNQLKLVKGSDFEAVDVSSLMVDEDSGQIVSASQVNPNPPSRPVRLVFIHHSTGENWLSDANGKLGIALRDNNYFVSDTNYGWGLNDIGSYTDIGHWWFWFRGPNSASYLSALYGETNQHSSYSRLPGTVPAGSNEVVLFKSCFPNSALKGVASDPVPPINANPLRGEDSSSEYHTVANAKGIYLELLEYFAARQDKLFVVITAPPLSDPTYADNARDFNNWLVNEWRQDYPYRNVAVFDFYNVLTTNRGTSNSNDLGQESGNHHRWWNQAIQHQTHGDNDNNPNVLEYPSSGGDDHPSVAGNLKATGEFIALLNIAYNCWKGTGACPGNPTGDQPHLAVVPASHDFGTVDLGSDSSTKTFTISNTGGSALVLGTLTVEGEQANDFVTSFDGCSEKSLDPAEECIINLFFSPTVSGARSAQLVIPSNDPLRPETTVSLSGKAQEQKVIKVISPNGGETWEAGTTKTIQWSFAGSLGPRVKLQLLKKGSVVQTIATQPVVGTDGEDSYSWSLPRSLTPGTDYQIRISSTKYPTCHDVSDATFTVIAPAQPTITVLSPNGGETWEAGTTKTIQWSFAGSLGPRVKLQLLRDGSVVQTIATQPVVGTDGKGSYSWSLPRSLTPGTDYQIRINSTKYPTCYDVSDATFTVIAPVKPAITVSSPNGGETWQKGSRQTLRWSYTGEPGSSVIVQLLKDNKINSTLANGVSIGSNGIGEYPWTIAAKLSSGSTYRIKIRSKSNASYFDISDANFTISN